MAPTSCNANSINFLLASVLAKLIAVGTPDNSGCAAAAFCKTTFISPESNCLRQVTFVDAHARPQRPATSPPSMAKRISAVPYSRTRAASAVQALPSALPRYRRASNPEGLRPSLRVSARAQPFLSTVDTAHPGHHASIMILNRRSDVLEFARVKLDTFPS